MNTRLVPQPEEKSLRDHFAELARYPKLARYRAPQGVELFSGRRSGGPMRIEGNHPSVLCIHGYCGAPEEVSIGCEAARSLGLAARAPLLKGHGGRPEDLAPLRFDDWLADIQREFDELRARGPVILVGMSLGSLLAIELALSAPRAVAGMVVMANPFWIKHPLPGTLLSLVRLFNLPDFGYPTPERVPLLDAGEPRRYHVQPIRGAISVLQAGRRLRGELHRVTCPTLVMHGANDQVCSVSNAWKFASRLGSRKKRVVVIPSARHVLTLGSEQEPIFDEVRSFLEPFALSA